MLEKNGIPDLRLTFFIVAYWHDPAWRHFAGAGVKVWDLAGNLHDLGHRVVMFLPKSGFHELDAPFKIVELPVIDFPFLRAFSFNLMLALRLFSQHVKIRPDMIYLRRTLSPVPALYAKLGRLPFFYEINDDPYRDLYLHRRRPGRVIRNFFSVGVDEFNLAASDRALVISDELIRKLKRKNPDCDLKKFILAPSGANVALFSPMARERALEAIQLDKTCRYIGFAGTLLAHQGIDVLIQSAPLILSEVPDCRFLIIGEGPMKSAWQQAAKDIGLEQEIRFTGQIPYPELPAWINAMDVCVAPYAANAGLRSPVKIFDYLACGRPAVASRISGTTDLYSSVEAIKLVEPENPSQLAQAILSILKDPEWAENAGRIGREWVVKHHSRTILAKNVVDAAIDLIHNNCGNQ